MEKNVKVGDKVVVFICNRIYCNNFFPAEQLNAEVISRDERDDFFLNVSWDLNEYITIDGFSKDEILGKSFTPDSWAWIVDGC